MSTNDLDVIFLIIQIHLSLFKHELPTLFFFRIKKRLQKVRLGETGRTLKFCEISENTIQTWFKVLCYK